MTESRSGQSEQSHISGRRFPGHFIMARRINALGIAITGMVLLCLAGTKSSSRKSSVSATELEGKALHDEESRTSVAQLASQIAALGAALKRVSNVVERMDERERTVRESGPPSKFDRQQNEEPISQEAQAQTVERIRGPERQDSFRTPAMEQESERRHEKILQEDAVLQRGPSVDSGSLRGSQLRSVTHYDRYYIHPFVRNAETGRGRVSQEQLSTNGDDDDSLGLNDVGNDGNAYWTARDANDSRLKMIPSREEMHRFNRALKDSLCIWPHCKPRCVCLHVAYIYMFACSGYLSPSLPSSLPSSLPLCVYVCGCLYMGASVCVRACMRACSHVPCVCVCLFLCLCLCLCLRLCM